MTGTSSARKRHEKSATLQNGFNPTNLKIIDTPNNATTMAKPIVLRKYYLHFTFFTKVKDSPLKIKFSG